MCGDALGRPIEFKFSTAVDRAHGTIRDMLGYGTHGKPAGTVTDDIDIALCIARSLVDRDGFDPADENPFGRALVFLDDAPEKLVSAVRRIPDVVDLAQL